MASQERFGYEWAKFSEMDPNYEMQFRQWIGPLTEEDFTNKSVLDAGCGMGRNSYYSLKWGAQKIVAFDYDSRTVESAKRTLAQFGGRATVAFENIYDISWKNEFDLAISIGVIDHLEDPKKAIDNLVKALKPGGRLLIWVYSCEGNEWIVKWVNPVRIHVTSKLPVEWVNVLSYIAAVPVWLLAKIFRGPSSYMRQLSKFRFRNVHAIVLDQLIPRVANYWTKEEARGLLELPELTDVQITSPVNKNGWTVSALKSREPATQRT